MYQFNRFISYERNTKSMSEKKVTSVRKRTDLSKDEVFYAIQHGNHSVKRIEIESSTKPRDVVSNPTNVITFGENEVQSKVVAHKLRDCKTLETIVDSGIEVYPSEGLAAIESYNRNVAAVEEYYKTVAAWFIYQELLQKINWQNNTKDNSKNNTRKHKKINSKINKEKKKKTNYLIRVLKKNHLKKHGISI